MDAKLTKRYGKKTNELSILPSVTAKIHFFSCKKNFLLTQSGVNCSKESSRLFKADWSTKKTGRMVDLRFLPLKC